VLGSFLITLIKKIQKMSEMKLPNLVFGNSESVLLPQQQSVIAAMQLIQSYQELKQSIFICDIYSYISSNKKIEKNIKNFV